MCPVNLKESLYGNMTRWSFVTLALQELLNSRPAETMTVLDFGCGTGELLSLPLATLGFTVRGIDPHLPSVEKANATARMMTTAEGKPISATYSTELLENLIQDSRRFDIIIASEVLEHIDHPEPVIEQLSELLNDGGLCIVTIPNGFGPFENLKRIEHVLKILRIDPFLDKLFQGFVKAVRKLKGKSAQVPNAHGDGYLNYESGHVQFYRLRPFLNMFERLGFTCTKMEGRTFVCGPYVDLWAQLLPGRKKIYSWNAAIAKKMPLRFCSGWMFVFKNTKLLKQ